MDRKTLNEKELKYLASESKKNPNFFKRGTFHDDSSFLEKIGIFLPAEIAEKRFLGYLKLWPQDFIVEEVLPDGSVQTIDLGPLMQETKKSLGASTYATLVKSGISTIQAVQEIASFLQVPHKNIRYAGLKDKDALSSQKIGLKDVSPEALSGVKSPYFFLKDIHRGRGIMQMGSLKGNRFTILVRTDSEFQEELFMENLDKVLKEGFFNFFYSQRFSNPRFINWSWGLAILKGNYQDAVRQYLCSVGPRETLFFKELRKTLVMNFGKWEEMKRLLEPLPLMMQSELKLLTHLVAHPDDFEGALGQISEQVKLWMFAYGSLLFNKKISEYVKNGQPLPKELPLIFSPDQNDWATYLTFLEEDGLMTIPLESHKHFPQVAWQKRTVPTKEFAVLHAKKKTPEGMVLQFDLPKGSYATTFLCHLFTLVNGFPPEYIMQENVDVKEVLGVGSTEKTVEQLHETIHSQAENEYERFE